MRGLILICALLLMSCSTTQHVYRDGNPYIEHKSLYSLPGWEVKQNKGIFSEEEVADYFAYFIDRWQTRQLPGSIEEIREQFNLIELHWQKTKFINPEADKGILLGYTINRRFKDKISIFVYDCSQRKNPVLGNTALGHELVHVALLATTGSLQRDHYYGPGSNWSISYQDLEDEVNERFR